MTEEQRVDAATRRLRGEIVRAISMDPDILGLDWDDVEYAVTDAIEDMRSALNVYRLEAEGRGALLRDFAERHRRAQRLREELSDEEA